MTSPRAQPVDSGDASTRDLASSSTSNSTLARVFTTGYTLSTGPGGLGFVTASLMAGQPLSGVNLGCEYA